MELKDFGKLNYLSITNLRSIELVEMELEGKSFVPISGPNGAGKSTVIDALMILFNGGVVPKQIIKDGGDNAEITVKTSTGIKITKKIKLNRKGEQATSLVMQKDNESISKPQVILKELFNGFMTPNKIANATGRDLYNSVLKLMNTSFDELEGKISVLKTDISENAVLIKNQGLNEKPDCEEKSFTEYDLAKHNLVKEKLSICQSHITMVKTDQETLESLEQDLVILNQEIAEQRAKCIKRNDAILKEKPELNRLFAENEAFNSALENRDSALLWKTYNDKLDTAKKLASDKNELNEQLKEAQNNLTEAYANAETPISELAITEEKTVLLNSLPWENSCFSDRMKAAAKLSILGNDEEKLPIMFIEHGECLSVEKRNEIAKVAIDQGSIVFIEVFTEDTTNISEGIVLSLPENPYIPAKDIVDNSETLEEDDIFVEFSNKEEKLSVLDNMDNISKGTKPMEIEIQAEDLWGDVKL